MFKYYGCTFKKSMTAGVFSTRDGILLSNDSRTGGTGSDIPYAQTFS